MKYTVALIMTKYLKVGEEWQNVDVKRAFAFRNWDDVQSFIGYLVEGADGSVKFEVEEVEQEA